MLDYFLKNSVGNMMENDEEDVSWVKSMLHNLGFRKNPPQNGIIEQETDDAIRGFQKAKGLKVDGYLMPGGETERALKHEGIDDEKYVDRIEKTYRSHIDFARRNKLTSTAVNLEHYLGNSGDPIDISQEKIQKKKFIREGERKNIARVIDSLSDESNKKIGSILSQLQDGESVGFQDHWDYGVENIPGRFTFSNLDPKRSHILRGNIDEALSTGHSNLRTSGMYYAKRTGDVISIDGRLDHDWKDKYDFEPGQFMADGALTLEHFNRAKPFELSAKWRQKLSGKVKVKNGRLIEPEFSWRDE